MWVCAWEYVRGLVHARVGLELCARAPLLAALTH